MAVNKGKAFEMKFKECWLKTFPNSFILRLPDQQSGYFGTSKNISDFICFTNKTLFILECKSHKGASIPFENITQYDKMISFSGIENIRVGVILYLYEKDKIYYIPIKTIEKMKKDGKKSIGLKALEEGYRIIEIPSVKLRTMMNSDYSLLLTLEEGD